MLKLLIVDDHEVVRRGVKTICDEESGMMVFGEASTAPEALKRISEQDWDIVILDISLQGRSGLDLLRE